MKNLNKNETNDATYLLLHLDFDSSKAFVLEKTLYLEKIKF